jgi:hypothetical protein
MQIRNIICHRDHQNKKIQFIRNSIYCYYFCYRFFFDETRPMADEINPNVTYEKTFISPINEDISSTEHSSSTQHIEETQQRRFSSENINNDSHIEATQNGDHQTTQNGDHIQHSTNQTTENQTQFIQETIPNDHESTSPSHIQPINTTDDEILQHSTDQQDSSQNFLEQSNSSDYHDQSNINNNQDDSNLLFVDDQTSNTDTNIFTLMDLHDKPDQLKFVSSHFIRNNYYCERIFCKNMI